MGIGHWALGIGHWPAQGIGHTSPRLRTAIVSRHKNGTFKPTQPVTGVELIGVLPIAAEFRLSAGMQPNLVAKEPSKTFSDIQNYWAASILTQMSSYYSVAAAINEIGDRFAPKDSAKPNYAAAATLRMLKCVKAQ